MEIKAGDETKHVSPEEAGAAVLSYLKKVSHVRPWMLVRPSGVCVLCGHQACVSCAAIRRVCLVRPSGVCVLYGHQACVSCAAIRCVCLVRPSGVCVLYLHSVLSYLRHGFLSWSAQSLVETTLSICHPCPSVTLQYVS
jgi:hypothetical protein